MENTILVPIDFSDQSMIALEQSYNLAKLSHSSITLLNVIKTGSSFWGVFSDSEKLDIEKKTDVRLRAIAREVQEKTGVETGVIMRKGKVVDEILKIADYLSPNLIVMGTSSSTHISRKIIGSRALNIIKTSKFPVISVKGKLHSNICENILLPIDATKNTGQKVQLAIKMAHFFNSKITILSALEKKNDKKIEHVNKVLAEIKEKIENEDIVCATDFIYSDNDSGLMAMSIISFAHKVHADLIAIMTQQESGFAEFLLGSLATNIIHASDIPVLTINPKDSN